MLLFSTVQIGRFLIYIHIYILNAQSQSVDYKHKQNKTENEFYEIF